MKTTGYKYYSPLRPLGIGCFPKPEGNRILDFDNFYQRCAVHDCDRPVWGYIIYEKELTEQEAYEYDLVKGADNE